MSERYVHSSGEAALNAMSRLSLPVSEWVATFPATAPVRWPVKWWARKESNLQPT